MGDGDMKAFTTNSIGKIMVVHLGKGDDLLLSICKAAKENDIKDGILVSAIGSLRKATMHVITTTEDESTDKLIVIEKPIEIGAAQGLILNNEPHFHMCISYNGSTCIGHMEQGCEVQYLAEVVIIEYRDMELDRKIDSNGISYIDWH